MARIAANAICEKVQKEDNYAEEDRISQLPSEILITILSRLHFVEAVSTCVLSKRWKYLWTFVGGLNFDVQKKMITIQVEPDLVEIERPKYISWVNRVLQLHQGSHISNFKVNFPLNSANRCDIGQWISFAIRKRVRRLELDLQGSRPGAVSPFNRRDRRYTFPSKVYSHIKSPLGLSRIKYLTQLSLTYVNVSGEVIEHFLCNCPLLERLRVSGSKHLLKLKVVGPWLCLKFLEISACECLESVDIYAPNLASFVFLGIGERTQIVISHAPSLVDVTIGRPLTISVGVVTSYLSQLESLTLRLALDWDLDLHPHIPELTNLKNLKLEVYASEDMSFLDFTGWMEKSPSLHRFTLHLKSFTRWRGNILRPRKCLHKCLEVVEFVGNIDVELLTYFVQNATSLKKVIVDCRLSFVRIVGGFPRHKEWSEKLRERALELKRELPFGVELVIIL